MRFARILNLPDMLFFMKVNDGQMVFVVIGILIMLIMFVTFVIF